uniref:Uncharacterized protein n=1 Tax=Mycena chlorophos TaxID=658473 RepID=A0ABQ0M1Q3_MYCCL|nr:predicted protein [Mycena chlorophos]
MATAYPPDIEPDDYDVKISPKELASPRESYAREQTLRLALSQNLEKTTAKNHELSAALEETEIERAELKNGLATLEGWVEGSAKALALARAERDNAREMALAERLPCGNATKMTSGKEGTAGEIHEQARKSQKTSATASAGTNSNDDSEATPPAPELEPGEWDSDPAVTMIAALPLPKDWPGILRWQANWWDVPLAMIQATAESLVAADTYSRSRPLLSLSAFDVKWVGWQGVHGLTFSPLFRFMDDDPKHDTENSRTVSQSLQEVSSIWMPHLNGDVDLLLRTGSQIYYMGTFRVRMIPAEIAAKAGRPPSRQISRIMGVTRGRRGPSNHDRLVLSDARDAVKAKFGDSPPPLQYFGLQCVGMDTSLYAQLDRAMKILVPKGSLKRKAGTGSSGAVDIKLKRGIWVQPPRR